MKVNAVFEGGGMKAIGLVGAVKAAEEHGVMFEGLAGTSSGAMVASLIAAGYHADEIYTFILQNPFKAMIKRERLRGLNLIGTTLRVLIKKGLYSGDGLENWIREKLLAKNIRTFGDLPPNKLRIIASDISRGRLIVLPNDIVDYGLNPNELEIARAVRMSTSLPYFFEPVVLKKSIYIVDGGLLSNFPLWLFDKAYASSNQQKVIPTIGFQLVGKNLNGPHKIQGPFSMFQALFSTMMEAHDERYIQKQNRFRTIKIPTLGVKTTQFDISRELSIQLFESGREAAFEFFKGWSFANYLQQYQQFVV